MVAGLRVRNLAGASPTLSGPSRADNRVPDAERELLLSHPRGRRKSGPIQPGSSAMFGAWHADFSSVEDKTLELEMTL